MTWILKFHHFALFCCRFCHQNQQNWLVSGMNMIYIIVNPTQLSGHKSHPVLIDKENTQGISSSIESTSTSFLIEFWRSLPRYGCFTADVTRQLHLHLPEYVQIDPTKVLKNGLTETSENSGPGSETTCKTVRREILRQYSNAGRPWLT